MSDESYNGWKNYPTWCVNLWLSNDEPLYRETLTLAESGVYAAEECEQVSSGIWTTEQARRFIVADMLKAWVTDDLAPDLGASFVSDLLDYALGKVDWDEMADSWIEQVSEQVAS